MAKKTYVGHTNNLKKRLEEHNSGKTIFTSKYQPWEIMHFEVFKSKFEATKREKYLKSAAGRRWIKKTYF